MNQLVFSLPLAVLFIAGMKLAGKGNRVGWALSGLSEIGWVVWASTNPKELWPWYFSAPLGALVAWHNWRSWGRGEIELPGGVVCTCGARQKAEQLVRNKRQ